MLEVVEEQTRERQLVKAIAVVVVDFVIGKEGVSYIVVEFDYWYRRNRRQQKQQRKEEQLGVVDGDDVATSADDGDDDDVRKELVVAVVVGDDGEETQLDLQHDDDVGTLMEQHRQQE